MSGDEKLRTPWLAAALGLFLFESLSGAVLPAHAGARVWVGYGLIVHVAAGLLLIFAMGAYARSHWRQARNSTLRLAVRVGLAALAVVAASCASGLWASGAALLAERVPDAARYLHSWTSWAAVVLLGLHLAGAARKLYRQRETSGAGALAARTAGVFAAACGLVAVLVFSHKPPVYKDGLPPGYRLPLGPNPFAPSNAVVTTGAPLDVRRLSGSEGCGRCHQDIYKEWKESAHHWSSTDPFYRGVEGLMVKEVGRESSRYCASCHDPVALLSGQVDPSAPLPAVASDEGDSCVVCHSVKGLENGVAGNGNYVLSPPQGYLFDPAAQGLRGRVDDFLVRAWPEPHRLDFSAPVQSQPELCGACHKQNIDKRVNGFGWVQLQNQYDDWRKGHYNVDGHPEKSLACKDCHMRLSGLSDPAPGVGGKHRSHRFIAANQAIPGMRGFTEQARLTEEWLQGRTEVPEIKARWAEGAAVPVRVEAPASAAPGGTLSWQVVITSNKVGHNFPTGPLDLVETWLDVAVRDARGREVFRSGALDAGGAVDQKAFFLRALGVDEKGAPVFRHDLWRMVGQKSKRAIFAGYSDAAPYTARLPKDCAGPLTVTAVLRYRKVNQKFADIILGKGHPPLPITDLSRSEARVETLVVARAGKKTR